jgi:Asp-tRNA(Asn)/Glu-tRNA(Gln) amidotransferase A subunit family amidase
MARLVRDGEVTADDLAETARTLIKDLRGLNAVADLARLPDGRRADPAAASAGPAAMGTGPDTAGAGPGAGGALAGVPFAVKELFAWPGPPWTMGSRLMAANPAPCFLAVRSPDQG